MAVDLMKKIRTLQFSHSSSVHSINQSMQPTHPIHWVNPFTRSSYAIHPMKPSILAIHSINPLTQLMNSLDPVESIRSIVPSSQPIQSIQSIHSILWGNQSIHPPSWWSWSVIGPLLLPLISHCSLSLILNHSNCQPPPICFQNERSILALLGTGCAASWDGFMFSHLLRTNKVNLSRHPTTTQTRIAISQAPRISAYEVQCTTEQDLHNDNR